MKATPPTAGFSLVEVMCAILILGVGLVGLTQGLTTALRSSKEAERQTSAALVAAGQVETLRAEGYLIDGESEGTCGEGLSRYRWKQTLSPTAIDGLHDVKVVVEDAGSGEAIYELRTMLFDPPLASTRNSSSTPKEPRNSRAKGRR